jgi:drug/metabolite transporter (DMT)-like permease
MKNILIVLLGVLGVSFSSIFVKFTDAPSSVLAFYRNGLAFLILLPIIMVKYKREMLSVKKRDVLICFISGFFLALHFITFFESIRFTSVASSTVLVNTEVLFVACLSVLLYKEKIHKAGIIGIGIALTGSVIIALNDGMGGSNIIYGDFLAISGAIFMSIYTMLGQRQRKSISATVYTFLVYMASSVTLFIFCLVNKTPVFGYGAVNMSMAVLMTVFCTFMGHSVFSYSLKYVPAVFISTAKLGEPVFATVLALIIFGQRPGITQIIGGLMIISGLSVYILRRRNAR